MALRLGWGFVGSGCARFAQLVRAPLGSVALHVDGVIFTSFRQHENLAHAMLNGEKREPRSDDVA